MTVCDLNRDQLQELKQRYYADITGEDLSYDEIYRIDELVSDAEIFVAYAGTEFVNDDFSCSAGQEDIDDNRFIIANEGYYLHAVSSIEYQWSDWVADVFSKYGAQNALSWAHKNGYPKAKAIVIID